MKNSPQSVIDSYKRRQRIMPWVIGILAVLLVVAGIAILVLSLGQNGFTLFAPPPTATPTATSTKIVLPPTATVPPPTATSTSTQTMTPTMTVTFTPNGPVQYTVQDKDTCWDLAVKFKVDLAALLALNNFPAGTCPIQPGQKIFIPAPGQTLPSSTPQDVSNLAKGTVINYTLQLGDSLRDLALRFHSTQVSIMALNPSITDANKLVAGVTIKIQVNIATPVPRTVPSSTASTKAASTATSTPVPATVTKTP